MVPADPAVEEHNEMTAVKTVIGETDMRF